MVVELVLFDRRVDACRCPVGQPLDDPVFLPLAVVQALDAGRCARGRASRCRTVCRGGVRGLDELRYDPRLSGIDLLGAQFSVVDGVEPVDVHGLAVLASLDDPFSGVVVEEVSGLAVVVDFFYSVFFVPDEGAFLAAGLALPPGHVAVVVVGVGLGPVVDDGMGLGCAVGVIEDVVGGLGQGRGDKLITTKLQIKMRFALTSAGHIF